MALIWMDGFDHYKGVGDAASVGRGNMLLGAYADAAGCELDPTRTRTGSHSLKVYINPFDVTRRILGDDKPILGVGFALYFASIPSTQYNGNLVQLRTAANSVISSIFVTPTGRVGFSRDADPTVNLLGESVDGAVVASAWTHFEFKVKTHPTDGAVEIRINGVTKLSLVGVNTGTTAPAQISLGARFGGGGSALADHLAWIDDIYCWDDGGSLNNDFIGDKRVGLLMPADDTAIADWSLVGALTGAAAISEVPQDGDASYITTTAVDDKSEFSLDDITGDIGAIAAVMTHSLQKKSVAGICNTQIGLASGAALAVGEDRPLTEAYTYYADVFEEDPSTSLPWTKAGINAAKVNVKRTL